MSGATSHASIRVSVTTRWRLLLNVPRYWAEYKSRERRFNRRLRERAFTRALRHGESA